MNIATFSIVGRSKDGKQIGVAVASRFLAVGAYVPSATLSGAIASQAWTNMQLHVYGQSLLKENKTPKEILESFFADDDKAEVRQAGIVDASGLAATYTGKDCQPWAGGKAEKHERGSYAVQGNILKGPEVIDDMADAWLNSDTESHLSCRFMDVLKAGQSAGGDTRGKQGAALYIIEKDKGFNGTSDVVVDLRVDDSENPIEELSRLLQLHSKIFDIGEVE